MTCNTLFLKRCGTPLSARHRECPAFADLALALTIRCARSPVAGAVPCRLLGAETAHFPAGFHGSCGFLIATAGWQQVNNPAAADRAMLSSFFSLVVGCPSQVETPAKLAGRTGGGRIWSIPLGAAR